MSTKPLTTASVNDYPGKIFYIDNLKVLLTIMIVIFHSCIAYGGMEYGVRNFTWYYVEPTKQIGAYLLMNIFISIGQAFILGFFFLLSAYFIIPSYERKGPTKFFTDRLIRLGIPLQFYGFILSPILFYLYYHVGYGINYKVPTGITQINYGVLWFTAALLIFTSIYIVWRAKVRHQLLGNLAAPSAGLIVLFAIIVGVVSFFVRIYFPAANYVVKFVEFRLGHFSQYMACFILGLLAYKNNWFNTIPHKTGKQLAILSIVLALFFPVFIIIKTKVNMPIDWFTGGFHWQSLLYAVWEQVIGFSIMTVLLCYGKKLWNRSTNLLSKLSRYSYAVYIFHPLVLVSLSLAVRNWNVEPALKFLIVTPLAVTGSFLLASVILIIPRVNKVI